MQRAQTRVARRGSLIYDTSTVGIILDATALIAAPTSFFLQTLIQTHIDQGRPFVVPVLALSAAANSDNRVTRASINHRGIWIVDFTAALVDDIAELAREATAPTALDILHCAYEAISTDIFPIVTRQPAAYTNIPHPLHLEPL
ncbi:hypothetical protein ACLMAL_38700 [Nocardia sp. CWNU-33]|uniref:hypothetical protein n=1 Tax=Nocardia sp. CWNU-33 TaxID=3392117 RepID=UPI00398E887A